MKTPEALIVDVSKLSAFLTAYNSIRFIQAETQHEFYRFKGFNIKPSEIKIYNKLFNFLDKNGITPEEYYVFFYSLHMATGWAFPWHIPACYSVMALELYKNWRARAMTEMGMEQVTEQSETKSQWVDSFTHIEDMKSRLLKRDNLLVCKANKERYLGYHPKSSICQQCPLKVSCGSELISDFKFMTNTDLDIVAIRQGWISRKEANRILKAHGNTLEV